jgi:hypothetical protein
MPQAQCGFNRTGSKRTIDSLCEKSTAPRTPKSHPISAHLKSNMPNPPITCRAEPLETKSTDHKGSIESVAIACCPTDMHLARICVASVRYWYPTIKIRLIKDFLQGAFCTREIEENWNVEVAQLVRSRHGWGFSKLEAILAHDSGRCLVLDADTAFLGKVIEVLNQHHQDFIVAAENLPDPTAEYVVANYYNLSKLQTIDPDFHYPGYCFNTGQLVVRPGLLKKEDFDPLVVWSDPPAHRYQEMFIGGEQGLLNYLIPRKVQIGLATATAADFARWASDPAVDQFDPQLLKTTGYPYVLHWAGSKPTSISKMKRSDILRFYEDFYYSRVTAGSLRRKTRAAERQIRSIPRQLRRRVLRAVKG